MYMYVAPSPDMATAGDAPSSRSPRKPTAVAPPFPRPRDVQFQQQQYGSSDGRISQVRRVGCSADAGTEPTRRRNHGGSPVLSAVSGTAELRKDVVARSEHAMYGLVSQVVLVDQKLSRPNRQRGQDVTSEPSLGTNIAW